MTTLPIRNKTVRGIRDSIPSGYVIGRASAGSGAAELVPINGVIADSVAQSIAAGGGGVIVAAMKTSGVGITNSNGTLFVQWNGGQVNSIGPEFTTTSGTLHTEWQGGTVTALGSEFTITSGTLHTNWRAAEVDVLGAEFANTGGTLHANWRAPEVDAIGTGLSIAAGNTLIATAQPQQWQAGTVTVVGQGLALNSGTLADVGPFSTWSSTDFASGGTYNPPALSNLNLTIQQSGVAGNQITVDRATISQSAGKYYVEETLANFSGGTVKVGVISNAATVALGTGSAGALLWDNGGTVFVNGVSLATIGSYGTGDVLGLAVDVDNGEFYGRVNAGNWNNNGTANPSTNTGGISLSGVTAPLNLVFWVCPFSHSQPNITLDAGLTPFAHTPPINFTQGWPYTAFIGPAGTPTWNAGTVNALGTGLSINSGTLVPQWEAGTVTAFGTGITLSGGTLSSNITGGLTHPQVMARLNVGFR